MVWPLLLGPGAGFVVAWGFGRYAREASAGRGRDSEKALTLRGERREALPPPQARRNQRLMIPSGAVWSPGPGTNASARMIRNALPALD